MSYLPKGIPGTSFSAYLHQQRQKERQREQQPKSPHVGIFQDIEAQAAKDLDYEKKYPELEQKIRDETGLPTMAKPMPQLRYKGTIDGRIPRPYPGPAKEGCFWIVEWPGTVGSFYDVKKGDILVRLSLHPNSEWLLVPGDIAPSSFMSGEDELKYAKAVSEKALTDLKKTLKGKGTKAAPGPQKRKVILEDDDE